MWDQCFFPYNSVMIKCGRSHSLFNIMFSCSNLHNVYLHKVILLKWRNGFWKIKQMAKSSRAQKLDKFYPFPKPTFQMTNLWLFNNIKWLTFWPAVTPYGSGSKRRWRRESWSVLAGVEATVWSFWFFFKEKSMKKLWISFICVNPRWLDYFRNIKSMDSIIPET